MAVNVCWVICEAREAGYFTATFIQSKKCSRACSQDWVLYMSLGAISLFMTLRPTHLLPTVATSPFHVGRSPIFLWDLSKIVIDTRQSGNPSSRTGLGVAKWAFRGSLLGSFLERFSSVTSRTPGKTAPLLVPDLSCLSVMPDRAAVIWKPELESSVGSKPSVRLAQWTKATASHKIEGPLLCPFSGHPGTFDTQYLCFKPVELGWQPLLL